MDSEDCPIVRAIRRLNNDSIYYDVSYLRINSKWINIAPLEDRVVAMYKTIKPDYTGPLPPEKPKDFEYMIEYEE